MTFKIIETQEQLDEIVGDRVARAKESTRKEFEGFLSPADVESKTKDLSAQITSLSAQLKDVKAKADKYDSDIAERDAKIKSYETASVKSKVAHELDLSYEAIAFLQGEDEETIRKSAESLKNLVGGYKQTPPPGSHSEEDGADGSSDQLKMLREIRNKGE